MTEKEKTCAELVESQMEMREEYLTEIYDKIITGIPEIEDEGWANYHELILEVTEYRTIKILFSTGGPSDWVEAIVSDGDELISATYPYSDWFDHASVRVKKNSVLWQYIAEHVETY